MKKSFWKFALLLLSVNIIFVSGLTAQKGKKRTSTPKASSTARNDELAKKYYDEGVALVKTATVASFNQAIDKFNQALELVQTSGNRKVQALCYSRLGNTYLDLRNPQAAFDNYQKAYEIYVELKDYQGQGATLNNLGSLARDVGQLNEAISYYQKASALNSYLQPPQIARIENGLGEVYFGLGRFQEALEQFKQSNQLWAVSVKNEDKVRAQYNLGRTHLSLSNSEEGLRWLNQALADSRQYNNPVLEGDILEALAWYYDATGNVAKAIDLRKQIFTAYRSSKASTVTDTRVLVSLVNLIVSYYKAGDFSSAMQYTDDGISFGQQKKEVYSTTYLLSNKGTILTEQGKYQDALGYFNQALDTAKQLGNDAIVAHILGAIGRVYLENGEYQQSLNFQNQAMQRLASSPDSEVESKIYAYSIMTYSLLGEKGKASDSIRQAIGKRLNNRNTQGTILLLYAIGFSQLNANLNQEALKTFNQAFMLAANIGHEVEKAKILYSASFAYLATGEIQNSIQSAQSSHDFYKKIGNDYMDMKTHLTMGTGYFRLNQTEAAIGNFNSALGLAQKLNDVKTQTIAHYDTGLVYRQSQNYEQAIESFNQSLNLAENSGDKASQKEILNEIANTFEKTGDKKKTKEYRDKAKKIKD